MNDCRNFSGMGAFVDPFDIFDVILGGDLSAPSHLPENILAGKFPPCDILKDEKEGTLKYQFAIAGYSDSEVDLQFKDDHMYLSINPVDKDLGDFKYVQKGIKSSKSSLSAYIPSNKYDIDNANAEIKNGILTVIIPTRPEAKPKKINIVSSD